MSSSAGGPLVSYGSAQAGATGRQDMRQRDAWGNYEAKPQIHRARREDAGSLLEYRQGPGIDLYNIIDGRSSTFIFARGNRDQGGLYEERRLHPDSGSFGEDITAFMPKQAAIGYLHKGPLEEFLLPRSAGSLPIEYGKKKDAAVNEPAPARRKAHAGSNDLYGVAGEARRPKTPGAESGKERYPATHTALARTAGSNRGMPGDSDPARSFPVAAAGVQREKLKGEGSLQAARLSIRTEKSGSLNELPQQIQILSSTGESTRKIEADRQDVPVFLLSAPQTADAGRFTGPLLFAVTPGSLSAGFPVSHIGSLVLRDPEASASSAAEGQIAQAPATPLPDPESDVEKMRAEGASPGPASAPADTAPARTGKGGTPSSVLQTDDVLKEGPREGSGRIFPFLTASRGSAKGQSKIYRGIPTPRLDSVTREDRDAGESGRRWWGKDLFAR